MSINQWRIGMNGQAKQVLIGVPSPPPEPEEPPVMRFNEPVNSQLIALLAEEF